MTTHFVPDRAHTLTADTVVRCEMVHSGLNAVASPWLCTRRNVRSSADFSLSDPWLRRRNCDWKALMGDTHRVQNLYTPESNYRKSASAYNPAARTKSVSAIRDGLRFLGGAQDDKEERNQLAKIIAEGTEVGGTRLLMPLMYDISFDHNLLTATLNNPYLLCSILSEHKPAFAVPQLLACSWGRCW